MQSDEIRSRFLKFFENRGHKIIPSASLVPENDPSVLFNTAGMQPLIPYLMGQKHPFGNRLASCQKCVRTQDIDEVGDNTHDTFFEMMGNWSLGDYFKEDAIKWSYEFLTSKDEGLGLDPKRLYITVFEGDENAPKDIEAFEIWKKYIPENRIYYMSAKSNWWSIGDNGPCGADTEMFYDITVEGLGDLTKEEYMASDEEQKVVEIWNDVFMEYEKKDGKVIGKLEQKNVDTGSGLERVAMAVQGKNNIFETDLFKPIMLLLEKEAKNYQEKSARIVADHIRTSLFLITDGVTPSNKDQGYILRRLIRRTVLQLKKLGLDGYSFDSLVTIFSDIYEKTYTTISKSTVVDVLTAEREKFSKALERGIKEFEKISKDKAMISDSEAFGLYSSHGLPIDVIVDLAKEKNINVNVKGFNAFVAEHQELSRSSSGNMFKGGITN